MFALTSNGKHTGAGNNRAPDLLLCHWQERYREDDRNVTQDDGNTLRLGAVS